MGELGSPFRSAALKERTMNLNDFYNEVSRRTDTPGTAISVADTRRVLSEAFGYLAELDSVEASQVLSRGLAAARTKAAKRETSVVKVI